MRRQVATIMIFAAVAYAGLIAAGTLRVDAFCHLSASCSSDVCDAAWNLDRETTGIPTDATLVASTDEIDVEELMLFLVDTEAPELPPRPIDGSVAPGEPTYIPDLARFRTCADLTYG